MPALRLAESAGLHDLLEERLRVDSPNPVAKSAGVIGGMLAGADCIDDLDLLRHGGMRRIFARVRAPSTLGTYLRSFTHGHVQQLDQVASGVLAGLGQRVPGLIAGAQVNDGLAFLDVDDTIREVHGYAKQGAAYGYSRVRGLNAQLAVLSTPVAAPVIARARLRRGNVASAAGAGRLLAQAITTARSAGVRSQILARADSAYYGHAFVGTALRHGLWFSVTARMTATVQAAIASIEEDTWRTIAYPNAVYDETEQRWISDAEVGRGRLRRVHRAPHSRPCLLSLGGASVEARSMQGTVTFADILLEEVGEAMAESDPVLLLGELVQVAAVAVAWSEKLIRHHGWPVAS